MSITGFAALLCIAVQFTAQGYVISMTGPRWPTALALLLVGLATGLGFQAAAKARK